MKRDFTEKAKNKLESQIDEVNEEIFSGLTDALGDFGLKFLHWIQILDIGKYTDHISAYHKAVLDMNNTTKGELEEIFSEVYAVDSEAAGEVEILCEAMAAVVSKMEQMTEQIHPSFSIAPAATIRRDCGEVNKELKLAAANMNAVYDAQITYREGQAALEAVKGIAGGALSFAGEVFGFTAGMAKGMVTGDFSSAASAGWGIINAPFSIGQDLIALSMAGIGFGIGVLGGKRNVRETALEYTEDYLSRDGLSSELEDLAGKNDGVYGDILKGFAAGSSTLDMTKDAYDICKSFSDIKEMTAGKGMKNPGDWIEKGLSEAGVNINITEKGLSLSPDKLKNTKKLVSGSQLRKLNKIYQAAGEKKNIISNVNTVRGYVEATFDPERLVEDEFFGHTTVGGLVSDIKNLGKKILIDPFIVVN